MSERGKQEKCLAKVGSLELCGPIQNQLSNNNFNYEVSIDYITNNCPKKQAKLPALLNIPLLKFCLSVFTLL